MDAHEPNQKPSPHDKAEAVLDTVRQVAMELHPYTTSVVSGTLDSSLERVFGLDSLGRMELIIRMERTFNVRLSEQLLATADTPRDLLRTVQSAPRFGTFVTPKVVKTMAVEDAEPALSQAETLIDMLDWHVSSHPQRPHIYLYGESGQVEEITYAALHEGALSVAAGLQERGLQPGHTVAIMLPTGRDFLESFFGILFAGGIPVPVYPPARRSQIEDHLRRLAAVLNNALTTTLITVTEVKTLARLLGTQVERLNHVVTVQELADQKESHTRPLIQAHDIAFLQYTSGSTGRPKGVILTHANLLANIRAMARAVEITSGDVFVSWLPLYHDMGLIGAWLGSLYHTSPLVLMSPLTFLVRPESWLWAIHNHQGTLSAAPNFAYELCIRKISDRDIKGLDLSSLRMTCNGAEPVSSETIRRFTERFSKYGFRPEAMTPVYGLAENSLALTFPPLDRTPRIDYINREHFMRTGQSLPAQKEDPHPLTFISCGRPLAGHQVRIVDEMGYEVAERQKGRLEFHGPSATSGYYRNQKETSKLFQGDWLNSGDLAYIAEGEVFLTGRAKDLIIRAGQNICPHEMEEAIGKIPGIRAGCVAVFGSVDPVLKTERLVVMAEKRETEPRGSQDLRSQIDNLVVDLAGAPPDDVVLVPPRTVLKTSSGKIRRAACKDLYEQGKVGKRHAPLWWQVIRLAVAGVVPQFRSASRVVTDSLYAAYVWMVFGAMAPIAWIGVVLLPKSQWRHVFVRRLIRLLFRFIRMPLKVEGMEQIPHDRSYIIVANHASYIDGLVLLAVLPGSPTYVVKRELADRFISRVLFRGFGTEFVERFEAKRGVEDTARVRKTAQQGRSVVFLPEGTFKREPGLRPFRMGAFVIAAQLGIPVVPLAIRGTRSILRAGQWFPRRGMVHVTLDDPLEPSGTDWEAAIRLRDMARARILKFCGEPDLAREIETTTT